MIEIRKHSAGTVHSQPADWNLLPDDQKIEMMRQEQLNEIMAGSEMAQTEKIGATVDIPPHNQSFLMQDRPPSNTASLSLGGAGLNMTR